MIVLDRKTNEEIMIGKSIRVIVLKVVHGKVKLGVAAPSDITICRRGAEETFRAGRYDHARA